ncbi:ABC transporter permease [Methylosinus sp. H3A]|uniref:ABC transporter permease n=1 Tax=Methylosinus sp. H3A TaxID=2785786 RepID=UPI0018C312E3|nr:ABC transporter permease [Methylosinus sp. H3A]MBG0808286.1 ABC transporter permease [Methylosinus sp. H3A]
MRVLKRLTSRLLAGLVVLWGTATLIFIAINVTPGDAATMILGGPDALPTPAVLQQVRTEYGLDKPLYQQYYLYISRLVRGDLGESFRLHVPVTLLIGQQIGATATLALLATIVGVTLSLIVSLTTAKRGDWLTLAASFPEFAFSLIPSFVIGLLLLLGFSFHFHLFSVSSAHGWNAMVLPTVTLALPIFGVVSQVLRRELDHTLEQPFILSALARGLSDTGVRAGHALRHALIPTVTLTSMVFAGLFSGAVVVETVFNRQGLGRLMVDATSNKDIPLVLGLALLVTLINVVINIIVDFIYVLIDPRVER